MTAATGRPRLVSLEIRGFRAFGTEVRVMNLDAPLVVVHAGNSQGKTSLAEAIEFLISGRSSRRELLGGAKAEYNDSLRNAHLQTADTDVYVAAMVRDASGTTRQVRRQLLCDFGQGTECESRLLVDGVEVADLDHLGLPLADPPVRAPVLLQHILRHVLSTEPKQRVDYFKALLELTDLDLLRDRVKAARVRLEATQSGPTLQLLATLTDTSAAPSVTTITNLTKKPITSDAARNAIETALLTAGVAILTAARAADPDQRDAGEEAPAGVKIADLEALGTALREALDVQRDRAFPLTAFTTTALAAAIPGCPDLTAYRTALAVADQHTARVAPVLEAVLNIEEYTDLDHPLSCPVCGTDDALTPERITLLREHLETTTTLNNAARSAANNLGETRHVLDQFAAAAVRVAPPAASWTEEQLDHATGAIRDLGLDAALLTSVRENALPITATVATLGAALSAARGAVEESSDCVAGRQPIPHGLEDRYRDVNTAAARLIEVIARYDSDAAALRAAVEIATRDRITTKGLREITEILSLRSELVSEVVAEAARQRKLKRINAADKAVREAITAVLDTRFAQMSDTITAWWNTVRPEELVGFGGIKRRAGGARFVNLVAALRTDSLSDPIERDALGVFSDSQLNALGLSIFLARKELLGSPLVVLDDPIPGSDADHRSTFAENTLGQLLENGVQVILTTFDGKLAELALAHHDWRGLAAYELNLLDIIVGTEPTQTADVFSRLMLEAEQNLHSPTPAGRSAACGSYRRSAERPAKQIIATGRTHDGHPTTVKDVDDEASTLGDLVPLVSGYAIDNAERGRWRSFPKLLNPGNHDDEVPSTIELKQVRGNLRSIAKTQRERWPNGLLL